MSPDPVTTGPLAAPATAPPTIPYGADVPDNIDIGKMRNDLMTTHVSAPSDQVAALEDVVAYARSKGHDISFVVLPAAQPKFTYYRDIAINLQSSTGGTVVVLGPDSVGSQGPDFTRFVQEESAANNLTLSNPPLAARQMVDNMTAPSLDWTAITLVLMVVVFIGAVAGRIAGVRRRRRAESDAPESRGVADEHPDSAATDMVATDPAAGSVTPDER